MRVVFVSLELHQILYPHIVRCHLVDPMHNLFWEQVGKHMLSIWKSQGYLSTPLLNNIQEEVDSIDSPSNIGHIPGKIAVGLASFTAEQWMWWTILYSPIVLRNVLPSEHYTLWCIFSKACSLLCRPYIHEREVEGEDELLLSFCHGFEQLYGKQAFLPIYTCTVTSKTVYWMWDQFILFGSFPSSDTTAFWSV